MYSISVLFEERDILTIIAPSYITFVLVNILAQFYSYPWVSYCYFTQPISVSVSLKFT